MSDKTVGSIARDLMMREPYSRDPIELQREMQKDYLSHLDDAIKRGKQLFDHDFYVVIDTKAEKILPNVMRNYFYPRKTCPMPHPDQTVYYYHKNESDLEYLWTIPCMAACNELRANAHDVPKDQHELLSFVLGFFDGSLARKAKTLNNEKLEK